MSIGQSNAKHRAWKHLRHISGQFDWLFFRHKKIEPSNVATGWPKINFFPAKKRVDNRRLFAKFPPTMKSETLNGILTFVLGALVVVGVVLALRLVFVTRDTRTLQDMTMLSKLNIARAQEVFGEAQAYNQKYPSAELTRILQSVQKPKSANP